MLLTIFLYALMSINSSFFGMDLEHQKRTASSVVSKEIDTLCIATRLLPPKEVYRLRMFYENITDYGAQIIDTANGATVVEFSNFDGHFYDKLCSLNRTINPRDQNHIYFMCDEGRYFKFTTTGNRDWYVNAVEDSREPRELLQLPEFTASLGSDRIILCPQNGKGKRITLYNPKTIASILTAVNKGHPFSIRFTDNTQYGQVKTGKIKMVHWNSLFRWDGWRLRLEFPVGMPMLLTYRGKSEVVIDLKDNDAHELRYVRNNRITNVVLTAATGLFILYCLRDKLSDFFGKSKIFG